MRATADIAHAFQVRRPRYSFAAATAAILTFSALSVSGAREDGPKARDYYASLIPQRPANLPLNPIPSDFPGLYEIVFGRLAAGELLRATYEGIRDVGLEISAALPPEKTLYVALGRSADVFALFLRELYGHGTGMYLPAKSVPRMPDANFGQRREGTAYIKRMMPSRQQLAGRRIALLDFLGDTGGSLMVGAGLLRRNYSSPRREHLVVPVALYEQRPGAVSKKLEPIARADNLPRSKMASIALPHALGHAMGQNPRFKPWAAYLPHYLWSSTAPPCPNPLHHTLRRRLRGFIERDPALGWVDDLPHRTRKAELERRFSGTTEARLPRRTARSVARQLYIAVFRRLPDRWHE